MGWPAFCLLWSLQCCSLPVAECSTFILKVCVWLQFSQKSTVYIFSQQIRLFLLSVPCLAPHGISKCFFFFLLFIEAILTLSLALPAGSRKLGFLSLSDLELVVLICGTLLMGSGQGRVGCTSHLRNSVLIVMCRHFCCSEALVLPFNLWTY